MKHCGCFVRDTKVTMCVVLFNFINLMLKNVVTLLMNNLKLLRNAEA